MRESHLHNAEGLITLGEKPKPMNRVFPITCLLKSLFVLLSLRRLPSGLRLASVWPAAFLAMIALTTTATEPPLSPMAPQYGAASEAVLRDEFTSPKLGAEWRVIKGSWEVRDGALHGVQLPAENHAAVLRRELPLHDFIAEFQFKFEAGKAVKLVLNKDTVHIATVAFWPGMLTIDKQPERNSGKQIRRLDSQKVSLSADEWHSASVEVIGNNILAVVDHHLCVLGSDEGLDIDKTDFDFAANESATLKNIKFHKATPPANVEAAWAKLRAFREASR